MRQSYSELGFNRDALDYANSPECPKKAKKHIEMLYRMCEVYYDSAGRWQDKVVTAIAVLKAKRP